MRALTTRPQAPPQAFCRDQGNEGQFRIPPASEKAIFVNPSRSIISRPCSVTNVASELPLLVIRNIFSPCQLLWRITIPSKRNVWLSLPHTEHDCVIRQS